MKEIELELYNNQLILNHKRAIYWPNRKTLIIADLHNGKSSHFRKNGISISKSVADDDLDRLRSLLINYKPETLLILGDLSHSKINKEWNDLISIRNDFKEVQFQLIPGNHDIIDHIHYKEANIELLPKELILDKLRLIHEPIDTQNAELLQICGHLHPRLVLIGKGRQSLNLPCFYSTESHLILPAFSSFTGGLKMSLSKGEKAWICTNKALRLIEV